MKVKQLHYGSGSDPIPSDIPLELWRPQRNAVNCIKHVQKWRDPFAMIMSDVKANCQSNPRQNPTGDRIAVVIPLRWLPVSIYAVRTDSWRSVKRISVNKPNIVFNFDSDFDFENVANVSREREREREKFMYVRPGNARCKLSYIGAVFLNARYWAE